MASSPSTLTAVSRTIRLIALSEHTDTRKVSPYSWFGFTNVKNFRPLLNAHGIEVDILPFFLGGARDAAGNPFAPTPHWKQAFSAQDSDLTGRLLGLKVVPPEVFPISSLFVSLTCPESLLSRRTNDG